jgi:cytochrome b6-f complex iron-sulfur subunit
MKKGKLTRLEFLKKLGLGGSALMAVYWGAQLSACSNKDNPSPSDKLDFTINLDESSYAKLKTPGNFIVKNDVVVAFTTDSKYVAVTVICSHEGEKKVAYRSSQNDFRCSEHGAEFNLEGKVKNGNGSGGLKVYNTSLVGSSLRIFS